MEDALVEVLTAALSGDSHMRIPAEDQLAAWETEPGFCALLLEAAAANELNHDVRLLACLVFKNLLDRRWRPSIRDGVVEEEKEHLRERLLSLIPVEEEKVALALSVLIGRIARKDIPAFWPDLLDRVVEMVINADDRATSKHALLTLHHIINELVSKRQAPEIEMFESYARQLVPLLVDKWTMHATALMDRLSEAGGHGVGDQVASESGDALLTVRVLTPLILFGVPHFHNRDDIRGFLAAAADYIDLSLTAKESFLGASPETVALCESHALALIRSAVRLLNTHPLSFGDLVARYLELACTHLAAFSTAPAGLYSDAFMVAVMHFIKYATSGSTYQQPKLRYRPSHGEKEALIERAAEVVSGFLAPDVLRTLVTILVVHVLPLRPDDLTLWESNPERFVLDEKANSWQFDLGPCGEDLLASLLKNNREVVAPVLMEMLEAVGGPAGDLDALLFKDAVYAAVSKGQYDMAPHINFEDWLNGALVGEAAVDEPREYTIIHRRILLLLKDWVAGVGDTPIRNTTYQILSRMLDSPDLVVRLTAVSALRSLVDDFELDKDHFAPVAGGFIEQALALMSDCDDVDAKIRALKAVSVIVEQLGRRVRDLANSLGAAMPQMWNDGETSEHLKTHIVVLAGSVVTALGPASVSVHQTVVPLISHSIDVDNPDSVFLMGDGLDLWLATLERAPEMTDDLADLFGALHGLMVSGQGELRLLIRIFDSYLLLGGRPFMEVAAEGVVECIAHTLRNVRPEGIVKLVPAMGMIVQLFPDDGPPLLGEVLRTILGDLMNRTVPTVLHSAYLGLFAKVLLYNQDFFLSFFGEVEAESGGGPEPIMVAFLDVWLDSWDNFSTKSAVLTSALAVSTFLASTEPALLRRFETIVSVLTGSFFTFREFEKKEKRSMANDEHREYDVAETGRRKELLYSQPIYEVDLIGHVGEQFGALAGLIGDRELAARLNDIDPDVRAQLKHFISLPI